MIAIACDHSALVLKQAIKDLLDELGYTHKDYGTFSEDSCDYPIYGEKAARAVASGECEKGIIICGTGIGISLAANKVKGIRCAVVTNTFCAQMASAHNNANMISLGARVLETELALEIVKTWLQTPFEGGRHQKRIDMITKIEETL